MRNDQAALHDLPPRLAVDRRRAPSTARHLRPLFRLRPRLEAMEDRTLLSTFLVTNTADSGPGSLRQAILDSNADTGGHEHDRLRHPRRGRPDHRAALRPAGDHRSRS